MHSDFAHFQSLVVCQMNAKEMDHIFEGACQGQLYTSFISELVDLCY
jgi:hypothetical protein